MKRSGRKLAAFLMAVMLLLCNSGTTLAAETVHNIYAQDNIYRNTFSLRGKTAEKMNRLTEDTEGLPVRKADKGPVKLKAAAGPAGLGDMVESEIPEGQPDWSDQAGGDQGLKKEENSGQGSATEDRETQSGQETTSEEENKAGGGDSDSQDMDPADDGDVDKAREEDSEPDQVQKPSGNSGTSSTEEKDKSSYEGDQQQDEPDRESSQETSQETSPPAEEGTSASRGVLRTAGPDPNHNVTMPDRTSHYFLLQKNSDRISDVSDSDAKITGSEKEAAQYIFTEYPDGTAYNFSPTMTAETEVRVGGGSGGSVSLDKVVEGSYEEFGELLGNSKEGHIVSKVFDINRCSTDPYAIYTNVGSWFDSKSRKSYKVDMKMTVTGALYPGEETNKEKFTDKMVAPYVGFTNFDIGLIASQSDDVDVKLDFFYHGTEDKIEDIKGILEFIDIDAQQGVDLGEGIEKVILFNTGSSLMQYAPGLVSSSKGYVSSQTMKNLSSNNTNTTVMGLFSGNGVKCRFTLSKCDHLDTGGRARYAVPGGYGIPVANSLEEAICYYYANSTGFMGIRTDIKMLAPPEELNKSVYQGQIDKDQSAVGDRTLILENREEPVTFILSAGVNMTPDTDSARYKTFVISDDIDPLLKVNGVKVFSSKAGGTGDQKLDEVSSLFAISCKKKGKQGTEVKVTAEASALSSADFYGRVYYVHINTSVKSDQELEGEGISLEDYYQEKNQLGKAFEDKDFRGTFAVDNWGKLQVTDQFDILTERVPDPVIVNMPVKIAVKKIDGESGQPVKGVVFGLFPGKNITNYSKDQAICLATSNDQGIALFETGDQTSFYREEYGDGPYCIKELSLPDAMKYVWDVNTSWVYTINSLKEILPGDKKLEQPDQARTVINNNREITEGSIKVYKSCRDTGDLLEGAVFALSAWSESRKEYVDIANLEESKDALGRLVYTNKNKVTCTMDNLGRFKIREIKAPRGCVLTGKEWSFLAEGDLAAKTHEFNYQETSSEKTSKGSVICRNSLQKAILNIIKQDDAGNYVEGVVFQVIAAEDIYAPWNLDEKGKPLPGAQILVAKGTVVDQISTGADGRGRSTEGRELYIGSYEVKETAGAAGHVMNRESYHMTLTYGLDQTEKYLSYKLLANNKLMQPSLAVAKISDRTTNAEGGQVRYDGKAGRFMEKKIPGLYKAGDRIDFTIHVTNTGNTPLCHLEVTDDMDKINQEYGYSLSRFVNMETASFVLPDSGYIKTSMGNKARVYFFEKSHLKVMVNELEVGDSIELHVAGRILNNAKDAYHLENEVYVTARYSVKEDDEERHLEEVPTEALVDGEGNSLVRDQDYIHIPGDAQMEVLKMADRTGGIRIVNGEMTGGSKIPGIYKAGEKVRYKIIVKNTGTVRLKNIHVKDIMSQRLAAVTDVKNASFVLGEAKETEKDLTTFSGRTVKAKLVSPDEVLLCGSKDEGSGEDRLYSGDYVELVYEATILRDVANMYDLTNNVLVNSMYFDGESDRPLDQKQDQDKIELPGSVSARLAKLADRTRGAVLDHGRYRANSKISGIYESGEKVTYKITVTNNGTANLYHLILRDQMSKELLDALDESSVSFEDGTYQTQAGRKIRTNLVARKTLLMDFLAAGDSVDVYLHGRILEKKGNLFDLVNVVTLEASSFNGNEDESRDAREKDQEEEKSYRLTYHSNWDQEEKEADGETPCHAGTAVHVNGCSFDREGYIFAGWNSRKDGGGDSYSPDSLFTMPQADADLYAQWSRLPVDSRKEKTCRLIYDSNNIREQREYDEENPGTTSKVMGVNDNSFVYTGWSFMGWNTKPDGSGESFSPGDCVRLPDHDLYLYAQWLKNTSYTLIYDANNGTGMSRRDSQTPCPRGKVLVLEGNDFASGRDEDQAVFKGWNTRPDGSGDMLMPGDTKEINTDLVLYAQWDKKESEEDHPEKTSRIYYHANNGKIDYAVDAQTPAGQGSKVSLDENKFSFGLSAFTGWNTRADGSGKAYKAGDEYTLPEHDVHLYAQWKDQAVRLYYHSNVQGEKEELVIEDAQTPVALKTSVKLDGVMFENTGYHFTGWNERADGSGKSLNPGESLLIDEDRHLYAQWTVAQEKYRLTYHSAYPEELKTGQGSDTMKDLSETDGETPCFGHSSIDINDNPFNQPAGYSFAGWNGKADGSGLSCQPGDHYNMPEENVDLYAQWIPVKTDGDGNESQTEPGPSSTGDQTEPDSGSTGEDPVDPNLPSAKSLVLDGIEKEYQRVENMPFEKIIEEGEAALAIPVTDEMTDEDKINIPGKGEGKIAKLADKTEGVTLEKGRYKGTRIPGIYSNGERVDFSITVSNSGSADLFDLMVKDVISEDLRRYLDEKTLSYSKGTMLSKNQDKITVTELAQEDGSLGLMLNQLKAGDQLVLHVSACLTGLTETVSGLENSVHLSGKYISINEDGEKAKIYIEDTDQCHDKDTIGGGAPVLVVAKLADRTKGVILKDGRYSGEKRTGSYKAGDRVVFSIRVSNRGKSPAYHVQVDDSPCAALAEALDVKGFTMDTGDLLNSQQGSKIRVEKGEAGKVVLDRLEGGDSVLIYYYATVKKDAVPARDLANEVTVEGCFLNGEKIAKTMLMQDSDKVDIVGDNPDPVEDRQPDSGTTSLKPATSFKDRTFSQKSQPGQKDDTESSSTVKTGDSNDGMKYLVMAALALLMLLTIVFVRKKAGK